MGIIKSERQIEALKKRLNVRLASLHLKKMKAKRDRRKSNYSRVCCLLCYDNEMERIKGKLEALNWVLNN